MIYFRLVEHLAIVVPRRAHIYLAWMILMFPGTSFGFVMLAYRDDVLS